MTDRKILTPENYTVTPQRLAIMNLILKKPTSSRKIAEVLGLTTRQVQEQLGTMRAHHLQLVKTGANDLTLWEIKKIPSAEEKTQVVPMEPVWQNITPPRLYKNSTMPNGSRKWWAEFMGQMAPVRG